MHNIDFHASTGAIGGGEGGGGRILYFLLNPIPISQSVGITNDETSKDHD